jgi:uncharacterized protein YegL
MTNPNLSLIVVILDRSGSMASCKTDMEGGLNTFLKEQAALPGECRLTLVQFDTTHEMIHDYVDLKTVGHVELNPRGFTALYDAMGWTITKVGKQLAELPEDDRPGNVTVVVVTDGMENSSVEWRSHTIMELVTQQTKEYKWEFTYLGANQTAIKVGASLGVAAASSLTYGTTPQAVGNTYRILSSSVSSHRATGQSIGYSDEDRTTALVPDPPGWKKADKPAPPSAPKKGK